MGHLESELGDCLGRSSDVSFLFSAMLDVRSVAVPESSLAGSSGMSSVVPCDGSFSPNLGSADNCDRMRHASKKWMPGRGTVRMIVPDRQCRITGANGSGSEHAGPNHAITRCCLSMACPRA